MRQNLAHEFELMWLSTFDELRNFGHKQEKAAATTKYEKKMTVLQVPTRVTSLGILLAVLEMTETRKKKEKMEKFKLKKVWNSLRNSFVVYYVNFLYWVPKPYPNRTR